MQEGLTLSRREALEIRRRRVGKTQHAIAKKAGLHPVYGSEVLRGNIESEPALDSLEAAVVAFEAEAKINERVASRRKAKNGEVT